MVKKYVDSRLDFYKETKRNLVIEDEFSEYWLAKASNGKQIGKGSGGMDIKTSTNEGIDAMCIIMNKTISNEKSLVQNFSTAGQNLDNLFIEKKDTEAIQLFMKTYQTKLNKTKLDYSLEKMYIIGFISLNHSVYATCFELNIDNIPNIVSGGFTKSNKSIKINNFIDTGFGEVKLYKSKKRIELRLKSSIISQEDTIKLY